ncbi:MAG TPA: hypothetical protein VF656_18190 [Pyrinomonadaceae bacterium]|jgi:hypothetical protein
MEITQEYLDNALSKLASKDDLKPLATKIDVEGAVNHLVGVINETIAEPMERHFAEVKDAIDVRTEVEMLKLDMRKIKEALHLA